MKTKNHVCVRKQSFSFLAMGAAALVCFTAVFALSCGATGLDGISAGKSAVSIKSFRLVEIPDVVGEIDDDLEKITLRLPGSAGLIAKTATPEITFTGASIEPPSGEQRDFTTLQSYTVYGDDGSVKNYTVMTLFPNNPAEILNFTAKATSGTLSYTAEVSSRGNSGSIKLTVPKNTVLTSMAATIKVSTGCTLQAGKTVTPVAGQSDTYTVDADDFTKTTLTYTVTDANQNTCTYTLSVENPPAGEKMITSFTLTQNQLGTIINQDEGTIKISLSNSLLNNVNESQRDAKMKEILESIETNITIIGEKIIPANRVKQDFSKGPVIYKVYADDADTNPKEYAVTVYFPVYGEDIAGYDDRLDLNILQVSSEGHVNKTDPNFKLNVPFNPSIQDYILASKDRATAANQLKIMAIPFSSDAKLSYSYEGSVTEMQAGNTYDGPIFPERGKTYKISIIVQNTVAGKIKSKEYTLSVYRGQADVNLETLQASRVSGTDDWMIYPKFSNDVGFYTVLSKNYDYAKRLQFKPTLPKDANSKLSVSRLATSSDNSTGAFKKYDGLFAPYSSSTAVTIPPDQTNLLPGMAFEEDMMVKDFPQGQHITFRVTAEDRETTRDYRIGSYAWVKSTHPAGKIPKAGGGKITYNGDYEIHTFSTDTIWTTVNDYLNVPFAERLGEGQKGQFLLLGGGGAGGTNHHQGTYANDCGGGGGGGAVFEGEYTFSSARYPIVVGAGGKQPNYVISSKEADPNQRLDGGNGGITKAFGKDAEGGTGGMRANYTRNGASYNAGGTIVNGVPQGGSGQKDGTANGGGGGAGAGGPGQSNTGSTSDGKITSKGGVGKVSNITGSNVEYGRGGNTIYEGTTYDWGGGNGGNAERYSSVDDKKDGDQKSLLINTWNGKYGDINRNEVHIQGGNGIVIVRLRYIPEAQQ